jgi:predicted dehydrogenase
MPEAAKKLTRREALKRSLAAGAAAAIPTIVPASVLGGAERAAPSERITLGVIGIGPRATFDLGCMLKLNDCQCVAICDVQASRRDAGKKLVDKHYGNQDCKLYRDFRDVLARRDIDAVLIATGDHWHAPLAMLAARAGKDIYCEKPCGLTIGLCQKLDDVIRETGRVFQTGTQRRSVSNFQAAVRLAQSGKLGKLHTLFASVYTPSLDNTWLPGEPTPSREVCDWDMWLGPAPWRPYNKSYVSGGWRGQWDFDSGAKLLDWAAHTVDQCQWANKADETTPIEFEPAAKGIHARYANGVKLVLDFLDTPFGQRPGWKQSLGVCPVRFVGDAGSVETGDSGEIVVHPAALEEEVKEANLRRHSGLDIVAHARNFFDCVKSRQKPVANSAIMRRSHTASHAAALSWILGRKLAFDPVKEEFIGDDEANGLKSRAARAPWSV